MRKTPVWRGYAVAALGAAAATVLGVVMTPRFDIVNVAMVYLLPVVVVALLYARGPAITCASLSVLVFDLVFVPPQGMVTVDDVQYLFTFLVLLVVALVIAELGERGRRDAVRQAELAGKAQVERMRSTLLASISHDLRTPLAVIAGASSTLVERGESLASDERRALAASIVGRADDMFSLITKVLEMTRLESGQVEPRREWCAPAELAATVAARLAVVLASHRLVVDVPACLPLVQVDAMMIEQVLANLLENAARHTPAGTLVGLNARQDGAWLAIGVEDRGPGLPEAAMATLFDKFSRSGVAAPAAGMGLGLAICRAVVALHGGTIHAEAAPGGGLALRVRLPLAPQPGVPAETEPG